MKGEFKIVMRDDGVFEEHDDIYDITNHCTSEEEQNKAVDILSKRLWIPVEEELPSDRAGTCCCHFPTVPVH